MSKRNGTTGEKYCKGIMYFSLRSVVLLLFIIFLNIISLQAKDEDEYVFAIHPMMISASEKELKTVEQLVRLKQPYTEVEFVRGVCLSDEKNKGAAAKILSEHGFKFRGRLFVLSLEKFLSDDCSFVFFTSKADADYKKLLESKNNGMSYGFIETGEYKQAGKQRIPKKKAEQEKQKRNLKREKSGLGYKDIKFGMSINDIKRGGFCNKMVWTANVWIYIGEECYRVAGRKRNISFIYTRPTEQNASWSDEKVYLNKSKLVKLDIHFGDYDPSFWKLLKESLGKKYKFEYELSTLQQVKNGYNKMMFFDEGRIALYQFDQKRMYVQYSKDTIDDYAKFQPNTVKQIDSSDL